MIRYPLAAQGVYWSIQGEGHLSGVPMVFVRLAGCSVGCPLCDTDYHVADRLTLDEIMLRVLAERKLAGWAWVTGGEPTDHELTPIFTRLRAEGFKVALATAGTRPVVPGVDFLSVSPHDPAKWVVKIGSELKLVPGLNGFHLSDFAEALTGCQFPYRYVSPLAGSPASVRECVGWVSCRSGWRLASQAHKQWGLE